MKGEMSGGTPDTTSGIRLCECSPEVLPCTGAWMVLSRRCAHRRGELAAGTRRSIMNPRLWRSTNEIAFDWGTPCAKIRWFGSFGLLVGAGRDHFDSPAPVEGMLCSRPGHWRLGLGDPAPLPPACEGKSFSGLCERIVIVGNSMADVSPFYDAGSQWHLLIQSGRSSAERDPPHCAVCEQRGRRAVISWLVEGWSSP